MRRDAISARYLQAQMGKGYILWEKKHPEEFSEFMPIIQSALAEKQEELGLHPLNSEEKRRASAGRMYTDSPVIKNISLDRIHFLPRGVYDDYWGEKDESLGCYSANEQSVHVVDSRKKKRRDYATEMVNLFHVMQHEAIHASSYEADYLGKSGEPALYRQGYVVFNQKHDMERFRGLNEAVVEQMNTAVLRSLIPDLVQTFPKISEKEWKNAPSVYYEVFRSVLESIISNTVYRMGSDPATVLKQYEAGLFTGKMMHLADVDRVYGKGSLRFLSTMGTYKGNGVQRCPEGISKKEWESHLDGYFIQYFWGSGQTWAFRKNLAREVLSQREFYRFCKANES